MAAASARGKAEVVPQRGLRQHSCPAHVQSKARGKRLEQRQRKRRHMTAVMHGFKQRAPESSVSSSPSAPLCGRSFFH